MMFLDCPAYLDEDGAARCGLPAEVRCRFIMPSTDGPLESAMIRCPAGHWFNGPVESLTWEGKHRHEPGTSAAAASTRRDSRTGSGDGRDGAGRPVVRDLPGQREQAIARPNSAPAHYLGRPARVWITAMSPRHRRKPQADAQTQAGSYAAVPLASTSGNAVTPESGVKKTAAVPVSW